MLPKEKILKKNNWAIRIGTIGLLPTKSAMVTVYEPQPKWHWSDGPFRYYRGAMMIDVIVNPKGQIKTRIVDENRGVIV